jgi:hypothetical protein
MPLDLAQPDDLEIVERRRDIRIVASLAGRYTLADHRNARGERRTFSCRAVNVSGSAIALAAPVIGNIGERVRANIDHLGRLDGAVARVLSRGFVMSIAVSEDERLRLLDRIEWIEKHKNLDVQDLRATNRFVPANPNSRLVLAAGTTLTCLVIDLSESGAAISADIDPEIGTVCAVGTIVGRVVRRFVGGFAVQFINPPRREEVELMAIVND